MRARTASGRAAATTVADGNQEIMGMARGGGLNLLGSVISQTSLLGISILLARRLGGAELGVYWQAYAMLSVLSLLSLSGFGAGLTRHVAVHLADGDDGALRGTVRLGLVFTMSVAVVAGIVLLLLAEWLAVEVFDDGRLLLPLRSLALTLPCVAFTDACLGATKGFRTMKPFALIGLTLEPALRFSLTGALLAAGLGVRGAMMALLVSNFVAALVAGAWLRRLIGRRKQEPVYRARELFAFSTVSWMAALASNGLIWADTILLGILLPSAQVGVYNVATRLVVLASFVMAPINSSFAPRIADLYHRGRMETLARTYAAATSWILRLSLPAFIVVGLFPAVLLRVFGEGFAAAASVTAILAVGKLVDAATGPCALMLNMSGRPAWNMGDNLSVLVLNVGLNLWLIPRFGIIGSAVAWAASLALVNLARVAQVRLIMGLLPVSAGMAKGLAAGFGALVVGLVFRAILDTPLSFLLGVPALLATYLGLILAAGLTDDDRMILGSLRRFAPRLALKSR